MIKSGDSHVLPFPAHPQITAKAMPVLIWGVEIRDLDPEYIFKKNLTNNNKKQSD